MADSDDDFHDSVAAMADRLELTGNARRKYIHEHMTRGGYRMEPTYVRDDGDDDDGQDDDPFFGSRRSSRSRRRDDEDEGRSSRSRSRNSSNRSGGADNWYS